MPSAQLLVNMPKKETFSTAHAYKKVIHDLGIQWEYKTKRFYLCTQYSTILKFKIYREVETKTTSNHFSPFRVYLDTNR